MQEVTRQSGNLKNESNTSLVGTVPYRVVLLAVDRDLCLFPFVAVLSRTQPESLLARWNDVQVGLSDELLVERERVRVYAEHVVEEREAMRRSGMPAHEPARGPSGAGGRCNVVSREVQVVSIARSERVIGGRARSARIVGVVPLLPNPTHLNIGTEKQNAPNPVCRKESNLQVSRNNTVYNQYHVFTFHVHLVNWRTVAGVRLTSSTVRYEHCPSSKVQSGEEKLFAHWLSAVVARAILGISFAASVSTSCVANTAIW